MLLILGIQKRALVMVEPPGELRIAGVLEIDDGVFVAVEESRIEELGCLVRHSRVAEFRIGVNGPQDKPAEVSGRRRSIEAMIVIEHPCEHFVLS